MTPAGTGESARAFLDHLLPLLGTTVVVKLGGSTLASEGTTLSDLVRLHRAGVRTVVVHGGGAEASHWLNRLGLPARFIDGLRVTDEEAMQVVEMVLSGRVNQELVAGVNAEGGRAVGLSGADGPLIRARRHPRQELGLVGEIEEIDIRLLEDLLEAGYLPLIAPIGLGAGGERLNLNADTAAGGIAAALGADQMLFLTDVAGVRGPEGEVIRDLDETRVAELIGQGVIGGGMIPKVQACLTALRGAASAHIVDGTVPHAVLVHLLTDAGAGTTFRHTSG